MYSEMNQIIEFIRSSNNFLITSHINADGDAFASMLAMAYVLEEWNKQFDIVIHDDLIDNKYKFMWGIEKIRTYSSGPNISFDAAIVLDVPSKKRIGDPAVLLPDLAKCVKVDHHPIEEDFAKYNLVDVEASSASQILFELIESSDIQFSRELANLLFSGIMYDTGRFSFSNTRSKDFEISAELVKRGALPFTIANYLFFNNSFTSMNTLGYALANMKSLLNGKLSLIFLPNEIMNNNIQSEIEELANYSVAIQGVEVGLFIREIKPKFFKMSLRSKGKINVNEIARKFGGGGHLHAAGARYSGDFNDLVVKIEKIVEDYL